MQCNYYNNVPMIQYELEANYNQKDHCYYLECDHSIITT